MPGGSSPDFNIIDRELNCQSPRTFMHILDFLRVIVGQSI